MGAVYKVAREDVQKMHPHLTGLYPGVYVAGGGQIEGANLLKALKAGFLHYGGRWLNEDFDRSKAEGLLIYTSDRKSTRLNSSHVAISYAVFCLKKKKNRP